MFLCRTIDTGYGVNVDAFLASITREQFNEWIALYRLEPWGDDWQQAAMLAAAIHNSAGKSYQDTFTPADFVPALDAPQPVGLSDAELSAKYAQRYGAK
jgi:hypothetical protein